MRCIVTYLKCNPQFLKNSSPRNIIFDLGGVIIDLDVERTMKAFSALSGKTVPEIRQLLESDPIFVNYEKGLASDQKFRDSLRNLLNIKESDEVIDKAWNAMLGAIPKTRIDLLEKLRKKHKLYLLSNTNNIHLCRFNEIVHSVSGSSSLNRYFDRTYYSHIVKMRKPDQEIFAHVLRENGLLPEETLFLDDNAANLEGASRIGIQTFHVTHPDMIFSLFS